MHATNENYALGTRNMKPRIFEFVGSTLKQPDKLKTRCFDIIELPGICGREIQRESFVNTLSELCQYTWLKSETGANIAINDEHYKQWFCVVFLISHVIANHWANHPKKKDLITWSPHSCELTPLDPDWSNWQKALLRLYRRKDLS